MALELTEFSDSTEVLYQQLIDEEDIDEADVEQILIGNVSQTVTQLYDNREQLKGESGPEIPDAED